VPPSLSTLAAILNYSMAYLDPDNLDGRLLFAIPKKGVLLESREI